MRRLMAAALLAAVSAGTVVATAAPASAICITGPLAPYVGCNPVCSTGDKLLAKLGLGPLNCIS